MFYYYYYYGLQWVVFLSLSLSPSKMWAFETKDPLFLGFKSLVPHTGLVCAQ